MAPRVGFEPTTLRLTAGCSAVELPRNFFGALRFLGARKYYRHFNFRRNPLFQKFFQQPISGGALDLQVHPDTSISLSNSVGHVRLSLGKCLSGGEGAEPSREEGGIMRKELDSQAHAPLRRTITQPHPSPHCDATPAARPRAPTRRAGAQAPRRGQAPRTTTRPSKSQTRSTAARSPRSSARATRT